MTDLIKSFRDLMDALKDHPQECRMLCDDFMRALWRMPPSPEMTQTIQEVQNIKESF